MRETVLSREVQSMREHGLDAIVSCSPENFAYAAGFVVPSQPLIRHRHAFLTVDSSAQAAVLAVDMEKALIECRLPDIRQQFWKEFGGDPMSHLGAQLIELGLGDAKIGIELDYLPAADFQRLGKVLPKANFQPAGHLLARLRQTKTEEEVRLLRDLSLIADEAIAYAIQNVHCGDTEMDLAGHLTKRLYELGADHFKILIVATGERSQLANVGPTMRVLRKGDVCRIEVFPVLSGYHAGVCRTAVVQKAPPMADSIWATLIECKYDIMEMIRPGASCKAVYESFSARLARANLPAISFVGHGVGLALHEEPYIGKAPLLNDPDTDQCIEENMVFGFEPLCYDTGFGFGMQIKDILLVTASGSELLSVHTDNDKLLIIE